METTTPHTALGNAADAFTEYSSILADILDRIDSGDMIDTAFVREFTLAAMDEDAAAARAAQASCRPLPADEMTKQLLVTLPDSQQIGVFLPAGSQLPLGSEVEVHTRTSTFDAWGLPLRTKPEAPHQPNTYHVGSW